MKRRSKILVDLINDKKDVKKAFQILSLLLEDIENKDIENWMKYEINGYPKGVKVPEYRIIKASIIGTIKTYNMIIGSYDIPVPLKEKKVLSKHIVRDSVAEITQYAFAEEQSERHCLLSPLDIGYINSVALIQEAEVTHANLQLNMYGYTNILNLLKDKLIEIFKKLEKQYGCLDDYYIEFESEKDKEDTSKQLLKIIYNDYSVKIGDNNRIDKSKVGNDND